ncbi:MAG: hypothetical protein AAFO73_12210 [Pseudomonadota bacterium]
MTTLRGIMSRSFGVVRSQEGMLQGLADIMELDAANRYQRFENALIAAKLIAVSALERRESRGGHFRSDLPEPVPALAKRSYLTLEKAEKLIEIYMAEYQGTGAAA